jgi:hypothetical protein
VRWKEEAEEGETWSRIWQDPSPGRAASASARAALASASCATVRISLYDEAAGKKKGDARRRAELCGEHRVFGHYAAFFAPLIILAGRLRTRPKLQLFSSIPSALTAPCSSAAAAPPKGAAKTRVALALAYCASVRARGVSCCGRKEEGPK